MTKYYQALAEINIKTHDGIYKITPGACFLSEKTNQLMPLIRSGKIRPLNDEEAAEIVPVKRPIAPLQCTDCWAEYEGVCFSMIKGIPCATAIRGCEYQTDAYKKHRRVEQVH